jgi:DNA-binding transcriptional regulator GbsR (MarR family)
MKEKIIKLREDGKTYNEIVEILGCSKSTISYHCSKLEINESRKEKNNKIKYLLQKDDYFIPEENIFTISGKSWSFERLKKEVEKCILVCSNCHKEIHYDLKNAPMA